jgi:hypothetical protein
MQTPEGAIQFATPTIYDAVTLRPWSREAMAALWCAEYRDEHGEWPSIKQIMAGRDIGQGTAHRALLRAGGGGDKARARYANSKVEKIVCGNACNPNGCAR